ncbi:MAG TPA: carboxypeptidase-like regulatory domain-containing protein [Candidatus Dormibacteraeota bacterium]|nr:carboxypeptidase-like regulatory domain-containing protein [Candidatus Dormibacteraeota bacterium]
MSRAFASRHIAVTVFVLLASTVSAFSQATASLRGTITDPSGAVIPEVAVTIKSAETGTARRSTTDTQGEYSFLQVPPGTYKLAAEKPGFGIMAKSDVTLLVNTPVTLDLKMALSANGEVINVASEASQVNTTDASVGNPFGEIQVRQLPLQTRNVVELLSLQPGVTTTGEVLGSRRDQNNITLDGADVNNNQNSGLIAQATGTGTGGYQGSNANGSTINSGFNAVLPVPLDSVQEFRVTVAGEGPNLGRSSGGQVALVTKSGTNQLHGSLYEYNRNTWFAANTWFNNHAGVPRQPLIRNQFGASAGGKVIADRIFYFFNYEQRDDASGLSQVRAVPSDTLRNGQFLFKSGGVTQTLSATDITNVDPLNLGPNAAMLTVLQSYPHGNDPSFGEDGGLNFSGYRFNAPFHRSDHALVGKIDVHIDRAGKHSVSARSTFARDTDDQIPEQLPGQNPASTLRDNSKGFAVQYTAILTRNLINVLNYGYTRFGQSFSGQTGPLLFQTSLDPLLNPYARPSSQVLPTSNLSDGITWVHGKHTINAGGGFNIIHNNTSSYATSFARYGYGATELIGLGADIDNAISAYTGLPLDDPTSTANGMGVVLGLVNDDFHTDLFNRQGNYLAAGTPQVRSFIEHDVSLYIGDTLRLTRSLTLNFGLRWEDFRPPYEAHGLQVTSTVPLTQYFAERNSLQAQGVPQNAMPNATLQWNLNGPVNGKPTWWTPDNRNFAPRIGIAYAPSADEGLLAKIFGKQGALRAGAAMVYDRFGSDLITQYDQYGSIGMATSGNFPTSYSFSTSPRYTGGAPVLPTPPSESFPVTPPNIAAIAGEFMGISPNLKPPYSYVLNASFARELPGKLTFEVGYAGRISHRLLLEGDVYTPLEYFKDPQSGITWEQNAMTLRKLHDSGLTEAQVAANPSLVPTMPFVEDMWPGLANLDFPGSASANYFSCVYNDYGGSYLDCLHAVDRNTTSAWLNTPNPVGCAQISSHGCYTFFPLQGSSMPTWMNAGNAAFNALTFSLRRGLTSGLTFDFNYTWSHSIDFGSAAESGAGQQGAAIQNIFNTREFRGSSDFDMRHNITANVLYPLPIGRGRALLSGAHGWLNEVVGGWQVGSLLRYHSGVPTTVGGELAYNANYWLSSLAIANGPVSSGVRTDENGYPSMFANTSVSNSFVDELPGHTGQRAVLRLPGMFVTDMAVAKVFALPWEGQRIQFRAEAFNVFNNVNYSNPSLTLQAPGTFGEFQAVGDPRVMQFALRYEF